MSEVHKLTEAVGRLTATLIALPILGAAGIATASTFVPLDLDISSTEVSWTLRETYVINTSTLPNQLASQTLYLPSRSGRFTTEPVSYSTPERIVIIGAEFGWERGTERCAEAPLAGLVAT